MFLHQIPALPDRCDHAVAGQVAGLTGDPGGAAPDPPVHDQSEAEPDTEAHQHEVVGLGAQTVRALGQRREVHIVLQDERHRDRPAERLAKPLPGVRQPRRVRQPAPIGPDRGRQSRNDLSDLLQLPADVPGEVRAHLQDLSDEGVGTPLTVLAGLRPRPDPAGDVGDRSADPPVPDVDTDPEGAVGVYPVLRGGRSLAAGRRADFGDHPALHQQPDRGGHGRPGQRDPPCQVSGRDRARLVDRLKDGTTVQRTQQPLRTCWITAGHGALISPSALCKKESCLFIRAGLAGINPSSVFRQTAVKSGLESTA